ncbi:MAG: nucleotide pyrophosphohydrolase [Maricaulis sp.]|jgi:NTP pyrophosphatase (non-canonical NTP hydrolase)|nr:nucleotide pyrophosphohydrolase [Maricaulis sp.]
MHQLEFIERKVAAFRDARNWKKFHSVKNLSTALSIEASELAEISLWKTDEEVSNLIATPEGREKYQGEMADVFMYLLLLAEKLDIDLVDAVEAKLALNERRFPADEFDGSFDKNKRREVED